MKKTMLVTIGIALIAMFMVPASSNAGAFLGTYCFKLNNYADTWKLHLESMGPAYQITGENLQYQSPMNGGGFVDGERIVFTCTESDTDDGYRAIYSIEMDLQGNGTVDFSWLDASHTVITTFIDEPFTMIACPAAGAISSSEQPNTRGN